MRRLWIILANGLMIGAILVFVSIYVGAESRNMEKTQIEAFQSMTVAMEHVTTNYLEGEQNICDTWANHITNSGLTMTEALDFIRSAKLYPNRMAHIIYDDGSFQGYSTTAKANKEGEYRVSYAGLSLPWDDDPEGDDSETELNITRAYTNPINGTQSIAFYRPVTLKDEATGEPKDALLLYIVPVSSFSQKWVFPTEAYQKAEISLIDTAGNYIIKGRSFKNSSFFEFYKSYNDPNSAALTDLEHEVIYETGTLIMKNSKDELCLIAHTPVISTKDWAIVTYITLENLHQRTQDWLLIGVVTAGLLLLFLMDLVIMLVYNKKLQAMAAQADSASRAKTDFLSSMSHDIRTPMNAIIGLTAITAKNVDDPENVKENLRKINMASSHLLTLINDILDISKVESGRLTLTPVTFSIVESAENLVNISQPMVKEKHIDFNFRINGMEHEYLYADRLRLNQIFINLLSNAIKYTLPGGRVNVDMKEEPGRTDKTILLTYTVADTGMGMSAEYMRKMYEPFSRQTDSRINSVRGTGLGLAITKQMVDLMGGEIECKSKVNAGTTFTVKLEIPIADKLAEDMMLPPIPVLIADDDKVLLETARDTLNSIGAKVDIAANGTEAVEKALQKHETGEDYRVVILDWKMPDLDGIEAARRIREKVGPDVTILLISAYDWSDMETAAREAGVSGFISKPLFKSTLYGKINEMLGIGGEILPSEDDNSDLAGVSVLVAEDNDVNWEIISLLLTMQGMRVERAVNGQLTVDRMRNARKGEFDLIFMDIQMPVMNGLEATKAIRALKDPYAANIPIIAMTADAFSENVAECLAAGMNGHIAKPVDMKLVLKEIRKIKEGSQ